MKAEPTKRVLVWDWPVRVLHVAFAAGITVALVLGFGLDDEHPWFAAHVAAGLFAGGALVLRVILGVVGPRHLRFTRWPLGLGQLVDFFRSALAGRAESGRWPAHNPAASWVMLGLLGVAGAVIVTGLVAADDGHESLAVALLVLIGAHLAGLLWHTLRERENIAFAMVDGRKVAPAASALRGAAPWRGLLLAALLAGWGGLLWQGLDTTQGLVRLSGWEFRVAPPEDEGQPADRGDHREDDEDDD